MLDYQAPVRVVIVDQADRRRERQRAQLGSAAWDAHACPGAGAVACPLLDEGRPCAMAAGAGVVVIAADHPRFAELHDAYRRLHPGVGVVVSFPHERGPNADQVAREDAIAAIDDAPSLEYACAQALRRGSERRDPS